MSQKTRLDKNSVSKQVDQFRGAMSVVSLPDGVVLRSEEEMTIWGQFTRARSREDWRDMDLILLAKVVRVEADIRKHQDALDQVGVVIENKRGTPVENPLLRVIDTLQRQQLALIRSMSLNQLPSDPRTINGSAKKEQNARQVLEENSVEDLLAGAVN